MSEAAVLEISSEAFAKRLANLLVATRSRDGRSVRQLARASEGRFSRRDLKALEEGSMMLDDDVVEAAAELYGCDLGLILPTRLPVTILGGIISAGGVSTPFEPNNSTALLEAYLKLVRTLRRQHKAPAVDLRRDDIEVLAGFLDQPGETIVDRLAALMGASRTQRTAMAGLFASGAVVIGLVGTAMAGGGGVSTRSALAKGPSFDPVGRGATVQSVEVAPIGAGQGRDVGGTGWTYGRTGGESPAENDGARDAATGRSDVAPSWSTPAPSPVSDPSQPGDAVAKDDFDLDAPKIDEDRPIPVVDTDVGMPSTGGTTDPEVGNPDENPGEDQGNPGEDQGNPGEDQGNPGENQGNPGEDQGNPGENQGNPGENQGNPGENQGNPGENQGNPGENQGNPGENQGNPGEDQGNPGEDQGNPGEDQGNPGEDQGNPSENQGNPGENQGNPGEDQGNPSNQGQSQADGDAGGGDLGGQTDEDHGGSDRGESSDAGDNRDDGGTNGASSGQDGADESSDEESDEGSSKGKPDKDHESSDEESDEGSSKGKPDKEHGSSDEDSDEGSSTGKPDKDDQDRGESSDAGDNRDDGGVNGASSGQDDADDEIDAGSDASKGKGKGKG